MAKVYEVEIVGLITIEAGSPAEAVKKVKELFESDELTYDNLSFECDGDDVSYKDYAKD